MQRFVQLSPALFLVSSLLACDHASSASADPKADAASNGDPAKNENAEPVAAAPAPAANGDNPPAAATPGAPNQDVASADARGNPQAGAPVPVAANQPPGTTYDRRADGASCVAGGQCMSDVCEGQGCGDDKLGVCVPKERPCTMDLAQYCGCDGKTFESSGSCANRRYEHRGACKTE